jgi:2-polyprenyl-6-methoxyphenol hydroxylase-like FAD-dependent oxidoreductase
MGTTMLGKVAVVGGGPAGVISAAALSWLGAQVTVYERRSLEEQQSPDPGWAISLGGCAREAIEAAGLSANFGEQYQCARPYTAAPCQHR